MAEAQLRSLFLLRHAKSSWDSLARSDFERPLNDRGNRDAPAVANAFVRRAGETPLILSSSSQRARETAQIFLNAYAESATPDIQFLDALYGASTNELAQTVAEAPDSAHSILVVAHNPGLTEWANTLLPSLGLANLPTCGLVGMQFHASSWNVTLSRVHAELLFYISPQKLQ